MDSSISNWLLALLLSSKNTLLTEILCQAQVSLLFKKKKKKVEFCYHDVLISKVKMGNSLTRYVMMKCLVTGTRSRNLVSNGVLLEGLLWLKVLLWDAPVFSAFHSWVAQVTCSDFASWNQVIFLTADIHFLRKANTFEGYRGRPSELKIKISSISKWNSCKLKKGFWLCGVEPQRVCTYCSIWE